MTKVIIRRKRGGTRIMLKGNALDAGNDDNTGGNGGVDANYVVQNETSLPSATANLVAAATFTWAN